MGTVISFDRFSKTDPIKKSGVITKSGSKKLYTDFHYNGKRIQKSTGLNDTPHNRKKVQDFVDKCKDEIEKGNFRFAEAFPGASETEKAFHAQFEGWEYKPESEDVLFGEYCETWMKNNFPYFTPGKENDYRDIIEYWLLPSFGNKTFGQINGVKLKDFIRKLVRKKGKYKGQPLSSARVQNILGILRIIYYDAVEEHQWQMSDPFSFIKRHLQRDLKTRPRKKEPEVFRFEEWERLLQHLDPYYILIAEVMIMTGMIGSEIAGLRKEDVHDDHVFINNSIVRKHEKKMLKTEYRIRRIPMTEALRIRFDEAINRSENEYVFSMKSGRIFDVDSFRKNPWTSAMKKAGLEYRVPYTTRHSFAAWSLTLGVDPNKLVNLMGHSSKKMVYDVYGKYVEGLEKDAGKILEYFGSDFSDFQKKSTLPFT